MSENLEKFGEELIRQVRDEVLDKWQTIASGKVKAPRLVKIGKTIKNFKGKPEDLVNLVASEIIDSSLSQLLTLIETSDELIVRFSDTNISEVSDGLAGELYGENGWIHKYSKYKEHN